MHASRVVRACRGERNPMDIEIRGRNIHATLALRAHVQRRLGFALRDFYEATRPRDRLVLAYEWAPRRRRYAVQDRRGAAFRRQRQGLWHRRRPFRRPRPSRSPRVAIERQRRRAPSSGMAARHWAASELTPGTRDADDRDEERSERARLEALVRSPPSSPAVRRASRAASFRRAVGRVKRDHAGGLAARRRATSGTKCGGGS